MDPLGGPIYSGRNRSARNGGPSGVQSTYASQLREHEALFTTYEHLQGLSRGDSALTLLRKVASMVKPIMRKRGWAVRVLAEFLPVEPNLLGLNINRGMKICLRLRYHNNPDLFLPIEQVVDTLLHELSHNVFGEHDTNFHRLWDELRDEHEVLLFKGFTGEGFLGQGQRLGGRNAMPAPQEMRRLARASAEQRHNQSGLSAGSGRRLGGENLHSHQDVREVIAGQALLRTTVNRGCGSIRKDAGAIARLTDRQTFSTEAEEDDANNRAIAEALFDLMEAEESAKLNGTYKEAHPAGGLAWSKEHGLYDPSTEQTLHNATVNAVPSEEEQMRWALEESQRLAPSSAGNTFGGLPPESLVSVSPMNSMPSQNVSRPRAPSLASSLRSVASEVSSLSSGTRTTDSANPTSRTPGPFVNTLSPIVDLSEPFNPDEWACSICTCVNPVQFLACDACGSERNKSMKAPRTTGRAGDDSSRPISIVDDTETSSPRRLGWNCARCGSFMEHKWWTCSACGMMKESS